MKVGDRVRAHRGRTVHAMTGRLTHAGTAVAWHVLLCGHLMKAWDRTVRNHTPPTILPPDTPVTCKRCLAAMKKDDDK